MTVSKTLNRKDYIAGSGCPPYAFDFKIYDETDLLVYVNGGTPKILNTDYTVSGGPTWTESGGNVVFVGGKEPPAGAAVTILRLLPLTQGTHWPEGDPFPSASHEDAADRLIMLAQQFNEAIGRVFKVDVASLLTNIEVPEGAGKLWGWNGVGDGAALYTPVIDVGVITTKGDLVQGSNIGIAERLPIGATGEMLKVVAGKSAWASSKLDDLDVPDDNTDLDALITKHGLMPKTDKIKLNALKRKIVFPASCFETRSAAAGWAAFVQTQGTNLDYGELDFDKDTDEKIISPPFRFTNWAGGNITVRIGWKANAITGNVMWVASFLGRDTTTPEAWDTTFTDHSFAASGVPGTVEYLKESVWTGAVSELLNNDAVVMKIFRDANDGGDTLTVDAKLLYVEIEFLEA